jgi:outer membrane protein assembly factor BamB
VRLLNFWLKYGMMHTEFSGGAIMNSLRLLAGGALVGVFVTSFALHGWAGQKTSPTSEQHWAQWRGPLGTGVAPNANPPTKWSETQNVKWKVKIPGSGTSTPIIWGDKIFIQTAVQVTKKAGQAANRAESRTLTVAAQPPQRRGGGGGFGGQRGFQPTDTYQFTLLCLDRANGKILWQKVAREEVPHEGHHQDHGFSSHSPVTDGTSVFAYFGSRGLHCYDMKGNLKWSKDFGKMETKNAFGEGNSPALYGDTLVVQWDHEGEDFVIALNKNTGKEKWRQTRDEGTSWASPLVVQHDGQTQVITSATRKIRSYDLASGKQIWECAGMTANAIPTPVSQKGMVYATSGFRGNALLAIRLGKQGDLTGTDAIAWSHNRSTPYVPSPLLYDDRLYFFAGNNAVLSCFDVKTGQPVLNAERIEGLQGVYASPVGANDRVYLVGRSGTTVVLKRSDKLEVLASNQLDDGFDASPAIVGKELFLRGRENLYCIAEK